MFGGAIVGGIVSFTSPWLFHHMAACGMCGPRMQDWAEEVDLGEMLLGSAVSGALVGGTLAGLPALSGPLSTTLGLLGYGTAAYDIATGGLNVCNGLALVMSGASIMGGGQSSIQTFSTPNPSLTLVPGGQLAWSSATVTVVVPTGAMATEATLSGVMLFASQGNDPPPDDNDEWKIGDPIDKRDKNGNYPTWETVRSRYWKTRAANAAPGEFSVQNIGLMERGKAPLARATVRWNKTGELETILVPKELHHIRGREISEPHNINNLRELWPWEHETIDPDRYAGYEFLYWGN